MAVNKYLASSADPKEVSLTVRGVLVAVVPIVAIAINAAGGELDNYDAEMIIDGITNLVATLGTMVSSVMMLWGIFRKLFYTLKD